jgi:hypothetical protein
VPSVLLMAILVIVWVAMQLLYLLTVHQLLCVVWCGVHRIRFAVTVMVGVISDIEQLLIFKLLKISGSHFMLQI